jgi:hypothetical protein
MIYLRDYTIKLLEKYNKNCEVVSKDPSLRSSHFIILYLAVLHQIILLLGKLLTINVVDTPSNHVYFGDWKCVSYFIILLYILLSEPHTGFDLSYRGA